MSAAVALPPSSSGHASRILSVFRLHFANPGITVWTPLLVVGAIFAGNVAIWLIIHLSVPADELVDMSRGTTWSGASLWIFVYLLIVAVQAMNATFQFALGFGVTRRDYYLGSALAFVTLSAAWAVLLALLAVIEQATNGWWLQGSMFAAIYFGDDGPFARLLYLFILMLFFMFVGAATGALYVRWKQYGIIGFFGALAIVVLGGLAIIGLTQSWGQVGAFLTTIGFAGIYGLLLIPTVIAAVAGYLFLRRATARS